MDIEFDQSMVMLKKDEKTLIHGSTISFTSINYTIDSKKCFNYFVRSNLKTKKEKEILFDINGIPSEQKLSSDGQHD